jgi:DNA-binding SARP family transcriptional activator
MSNTTVAETVTHDDTYHLGLEAAHRGDVGASTLLNGALRSSLARNDPEGAALASAALLITGQIFGNYRDFAGHIARLGIARTPQYVWSRTDDELLALAGLLAGLLFYAPDDAFVEPCVERIVELLESRIDINVRFAAGRLLLYYTEPRDMWALAQRVYGGLQPSMNDADLTPHRLGFFLIFWARCARYANEGKQAALAEEKVRTLAEAHQQRDILGWLAFVEVERSLPERNIPRAERAIAQAELFADSANLRDLSRLDFLRTKIALLKGQADAAVFHAARAKTYCFELEAPAPLRAIFIVNEAQARLFADDLETACHLLTEAIEFAPGQYAQEIRDMIALTRAYQAMVSGDAQGLVSMTKAWASMRDRQCYDAFDGFPEFGAKLCVVALTRDIEVDFVQRLIELRGVSPPADAPEAWPWAIKVKAFGGFQVYRHGALLTFEGKAQKKPLELLKALIALGGRSIPKQKLCGILWSTDEPSAPGAALDVLISRLRKLLGQADAVRVEEGKVGLDARYVWLDVWAFDRCVDDLQDELRDARRASEVHRITQALLVSYQGPFLGDEDPQRWSLGTRDRLHNRFRRSLADAGAYWEQSGDWARAATVYERALEEDNLAEDLYRRLMQAYVKLGEPAEALRVYRRCREMLSLQLGIGPSNGTEALYKAIYAG